MKLRSRALAAAAAAALALLGPAAVALTSTAPAHADTSSYIEAGSDDPVSAAPEVTRPPTRHCTVTLADQFPSNAADGSPQNFSGTFTPPANCPGPWAKVVLDFSSSVSGRQYDRSASLTLGGTTLWFGTTQEPGGDAPTVAHFSKDVTRYSALFSGPQPFSGGIGNYTSSVYTGVFVQTATLTFYEPDATHPAPAEPDRVLGVPVPDLTPGSASANVALPTLPRNLTQADLEVTLKGNGCDEQWFTAAPDATAAAEPGICAGGPYREADVAVDGRPAGAVGTFPHIYSGGIVPTLWRPVLAIDTLDMRPENLDLTPFVGTLVDGGHHTLGVAMPFINDRWNVVATLFLWADAHRAQTSGALVRDDVRPTTTASHNHATGSADEQAYDATATRHDELEGYVDTSAGRIYTRTSYDRDYGQTGTISGGGLVQHIDQTDVVKQTSISTRGTDAVGAQVVRSATLDESYPITVDFNAGSYVDGDNYSLEGTVDMTQQVHSASTGESVLAPAGQRHSDWNVDSYGIQARSAGVVTARDGHSTTSYDGTDDLGTLHHTRIVTDHGYVVSRSG